MIVSVHQPQYIPWLGYFDKIARSDYFIFLDCVQYKPREFQNRNKIRTKDGWIWLTVPVINKGKGRQKILDVQIDNGLPWQRQHLNSLKTFYARAKFFDLYFPFFEEIYKKRWEKLTDLNLAIIDYALKELKIETLLRFESELDIHSMGTDRIIDICKKLNADTYLSGIGGKDYLKEDKFKKTGIRLAYQDFKHPAYNQQFTSSAGDFIPFMSIIDLLFNEGPGSREILKLGEAKNEYLSHRIAS
jgi:hypothetical protein